MIEVVDNGSAVREFNDSDVETSRPGTMLLIWSSNATNQS